MTLLVEYRLRRVESENSADALLILDASAEAVLRLCALLSARAQGAQRPSEAARNVSWEREARPHDQIGTEPVPDVFCVESGFLVELKRPSPKRIPRAIRLRSLAPHLFVPADAELEPALLDDEARGLVRDRGLVFLPGGRALGFDHRSPVAISSLVDPGEVRRGSWEPFPEPPALAERIESIVLDEPPESVERILLPGGEGIAGEEPRPEDADAPARAAGSVTLAAGKALHGLGEALGWSALSKLGASWVGKAVELSPRLSENLLGRQEAALRELLREFREGDLEKALRRALPLGEPGTQRGVPAKTSALPRHDLLYSLGNVLGKSGPPSLWLGGYDAQVELAREYRKAAASAVQNGDHRRAAFIYGKLLKDWRQAAAILEQGGLHHDAAVIWLEKARNPLAAARAFEAAGELDRALDIFRRQREHAKAGDLLKRMGEDEAAVLEYRRAADALAASPQGHRAAGELMLSRAERPDLALAYFRAGWAQRPQPNAVVCAIRMAQLYEEDDSPARLLALVSEAEATFALSGNDVVAGHFWNGIVKAAEGRDAATKDALRDRALLGIATKLRQRAETDAQPNLVSAMLGQSAIWSPAVVSDARHAFRSELDRPRLATKRRTEAPLARPGTPGAKVTAVAFARSTGEIFIGQESGEIACFRPIKGDQVICRKGDAVVSLAVDKNGETLLALRVASWGGYSLVSYGRRKDGAFEDYGEVSSLEITGQPRLFPLDVDDVGATLFTGDALALVRPPQALLPWKTFPFPANELAYALMFRVRASVVVLLFDRDSVWRCEPNVREAPPTRARLGWSPQLSEESTIATPSLASIERDLDHVEIAGIEGGKLFWSSIDLSPDLFPVETKTAFVSSGNLACGFVRPDLLAAVQPNRVMWVRQRPGTATTDVSLPHAVACFPSHATSELLVVNKDASIVSVPFPARI